MTDREAIDVLFNEWKCIDRNDGIHCDRKCESCDLVMDVWIIREAFNMAISALEAQEAKAQLSAEGTTSDLISRQAAIDAILAVTGNSSVRELYEHVQEHGLSDMWSGGVNAAIDIIIAVPSAQSEKSTTAEKSQLAEEKSTRKLIYLDDAIRIVESFYKVNADIRRIMAFELRQLPSAQPPHSGRRVYMAGYEAGYEAARKENT